MKKAQVFQSQKLMTSVQTSLLLFNLRIQKLIRLKTYNIARGAVSSWFFDVVSIRAIL